MDFSKLQDQVSNLTLYDIKAGVRKVQNGTLALHLLSSCGISLGFIRWRKPTLTALFQLS